MKKLLLILVCILTLTTIKGQRYFDGNLILTSGDTLTGLVGFGPNNTFAFRKDMKTKPSYKKESEVSGYQFDDDIYRKKYVEVLMGNFPEHRVVFLKVLVEGPVTLYEYNGKGLFRGEYTNFFLHHNQADVPFRVPSSKRYFRQEMKNYFKDHEELAGQIKTKELGYENLVEIVVRFNQWYSEQESNEETPD